MPTQTVKAYERLFEDSLAAITGPDAPYPLRFRGTVTADEIQKIPELLTVLRSKLPILRSTPESQQWKDVPGMTEEDAVNKILFGAVEKILNDYQIQANDEAIWGMFPTYDHQAHVNRMIGIINQPVRIHDGGVTQEDVEKLKMSLIEGIEHPKQGEGVFENEVSCNLKGNYANICRAIIKKTEYIPGWEFGDDFRKKLGLGPAPRSVAQAQLRALEGLSLSEPAKGARDTLHTIFADALKETDPAKARQYLKLNSKIIDDNLCMIHNEAKRENGQSGKEGNNKPLLNKLCRILHDVCRFVYAIFNLENPFKEKKVGNVIGTLFNSGKAERLAREIKDISDKLAPSNEDVSDKPGPKMP